MRYLLPALLLPTCLGACATGYASDWFRQPANIVNPQLIRYGFNVEQSRCIGERLGRAVSRVELRRFQERAAAFRPAGATLSAADLRGVAGDRVIGALEHAMGNCDAGVAPAPTLAAAPAPASGTPAAVGNAAITSGGVPVDMTPIGTPPAGTAPGAATAGVRTTWLNLGAAESGQSIAVDAMSIDQAGAARTAWFRMTDPETGGPTSNIYRLRIDCEARTVQPLALRQVNEAGAEVSTRQYTPAEATAGAAEPGTVLEIAFLSLCT
jgi:hypothetical protein